MDLGYYPGCSLEGSSSEYNKSILAIAPLLGLRLVIVEDWNCCGATAAHNTNHDLAVALSLRNLALAEAQGIKELLAPCAACSNRLIFAHRAATKDEAHRKKYQNLIEMPYKGSVKILNLLEAIRLHGMDALKANIKKPLTGLRVASYYGCLLVRPPKVIAFDDPEAPKSMDEIVAALGCTPVDWEFKTECCGGGFTLSRADIVTRLAHEILLGAKEVKADLIVAACPMCQTNLDLRQLAVQSAYNEQFNIPALFLSELIGVALGLEPRDLGITKHFIKVGPIEPKPVEEKDAKPKLKSDLGVRKHAAAETKA